MTMPLEGYRVLDFTIWQHGAYGTTMLADLGADVIKVEEPRSGDLARWYISTSPDGFNSYFQAHNRGKRSVTVNLKHPQGRQLIYDLVKHVDVVAENYTHGVMDKLGLGYDALREHNPRVIYASATGLGPRGPYAHWRSMDAIFQGYGGAMWVQGGAPGDRPEAIAIPMGDQVGAIILAQAIITALLVRERTGKGQLIHTSGLGSQITLQAWRITATLRHGTERRLLPHGRFGTNPTWHYYQDSQGDWFTIGLMAHQGWPSFCRAIGREELIDDPRFADLKSRIGNQDLEGILADVFKTRSREEWLSHLQEHGVPCGPIHNYQTLVEDPQVLANDYITAIDDPRWGTMKAPNVTMQFSETPARPRRGAPELGEHTEEVLQELLGLDWDALSRLRDDGAI